MSQPPVFSPGGLPEPTSDERTFAMIAHLSMFIGAIIVPLIVWMIKKDESKYVAYHAIQALIFQGAVLALNIVLYVIYMIISLVTFGIGSLCFPMLCIGLIFPFVAIPFALKANNGEWQGYPLISNIGRPE